MPTETALVVHADARQRQLVDVLLAPDAMHVTSVSTAREALEHLRHRTPDVIVLAAELPDMSGLEVCEKAKRVTRLALVPVVLVAPPRNGGALSAEERRDAERVGADLILPQPLGDKNLRERVRRVLQAGQPAARAPGAGEGRETEELEVAIGVIDAGAADQGDAAGGAAGPQGVGDDLRRLRSELEALRVENRQLRRKAAVRGTDDDPRTKDLERQVRELERRNRALLQALEEVREEPPHRNGFLARLFGS